MVARQHDTYYFQLFFYGRQHKGCNIKKSILTVSWKAISNEALAKTTPLNPPIVNININPKANNIDGVK